MNPVKLALLINDTVDAVERSKIGSMYSTDKDGNVLRDSNGFPFYNMVAVGTFHIALQTQIMKANIYE